MECQQQSNRCERHLDPLLLQVYIRSTGFQTKRTLRSFIGIIGSPKDIIHRKAQVKRWDPSEELIIALGFVLQKRIKSKGFLQ